MHYGRKRLKALGLFSFALFLLCMTMYAFIVGVTSAIGMTLHGPLVTLREHLAQAFVWAVIFALFGSVMLNWERTVERVWAEAVDMLFCGNPIGWAITLLALIHYVGQVFMSYWHNMDEDDEGARVEEETEKPRRIGMMG